MRRGGSRHVLLLSPYHGGSHAAWARGLQRSSAHEIELLTLPDRFWKWRMHGGAATLARRFLQAGRRPDVIVATDMLDLTTFLALTRKVTAEVPVLLYMHENQLTYPLPADGDSGPMRRQLGERDRHYAFVNFASMLAADVVAFNSAYHRDAWFEELPRFLRHFPEHNELSSTAMLRDKSIVLPVGIDCGGPLAQRGSVASGAVERARDAPEAEGPPGPSPLVIWNQRWEYDKRPDRMVAALLDVAARDIDFRVALCGRAFSASPPAFADLPERLGRRLVHFGFAERASYRRLLDEASITFSTADHEFFGIAVLEAMARGAFALLPDRLSYRELVSSTEVSERTRRQCLYGSQDELCDRLARALRNGDETRSMGAELARNARRFDWKPVASRYDEAVERLTAT